MRCARAVIPPPVPPSGAAQRAGRGTTAASSLASRYCAINPRLFLRAGRVASLVLLGIALADRLDVIPSHTSPIVASGTAEQSFRALRSVAAGPVTSAEAEAEVGAVW